MKIENYENYKNWKLYKLEIIQIENLSYSKDQFATLKGILPNCVLTKHIGNKAHTIYN